jgi:hypothetical protein
MTLRATRCAGGCHGAEFEHSPGPVSSPQCAWDTPSRRTRRVIDSTSLSAISSACPEPPRCGQAGNTKWFAFTPSEMLSHISQLVAMVPGDVVALGTPYPAPELTVGTTSCAWSRRSARSTATSSRTIGWPPSAHDNPLGAASQR